MRQRGIKIRGGHLDFAPYTVETRRPASSLVVAGLFIAVSVAVVVASAVSFPIGL